MLHLFAFAFSPRIPQVVPQTRFTRLSIAIKVRHCREIVFTTRTVTRRHAASSRISIRTTLRLWHDRGKGCTRLPFLSGKPSSVKDDCAIGSSSSLRCRSLDKISMYLDQRLLISFFFVQSLSPLGVQKALHFVVISEEQSPRRDSGSGISSTLESVVSVECSVDFSVALH